MQRRDFLTRGMSLGMAGATAGAMTRSLAAVSGHNWDRYDFGPGPQVSDRLNQGPFTQYVPDATIPTDDVVMATTASELNVPNYGRGLITYITADMGLEEIKSDHVLQSIEDLARFPLGQLLYVRPTWRELQTSPGRLHIPEYLRLVLSLARTNRKRIGIRVQMSAPDYSHEPALPDFVKYASGMNRYLRRFLTPQRNSETGATEELPFDVITELWYDDEKAFRGTVRYLSTSILPDEVVADEKQLFDRPKLRMATVVEFESPLA